MKLKKNIRYILIIVLLVIVLILGLLAIKNNLVGKKEVKETKIVNQIDKYGYNLKETKSSTYKKMFKELKKVLSEKEVDEEAYVKKISEMFIYDFYSLQDKTAKTDIGGVDFVYSEALPNFLQKAQNTYYKYVENNIYGNRKQSLPVVNNIEIKDITTEAFAYGDKTDEKAYIVNAEWGYTDSKFSKYQTEAKLIFIHDEHKLSLVELQ